MTNKNLDQDLDGKQKDRFIVRDKNDYIFKLGDAIRLDFNGFNRSYGWIFPKRDFFSCGIGAPAGKAEAIKAYFRFFLDSFYASGSREGFRGDILAHGIPVRDTDLPVKDYRVIAVGDAACLADRFTGEGLYNSFRSTIIAADSIKTALDRTSFGFEEYTEKLKDSLFREIKYSKYFADVFYSSSRFFYKLIKKNDNYFYSCCRLLRGERTYIDVFRRLRNFDVVK